MATFQNQATLTYGDNVTTSNVVTGELQQAISVTKYSVTDTYTADTKVNEVYAQWEADGFSEAKFLELAAQYNEDPGSQANGGLYENVAVGDMVNSFNNWLFYTAKNVGDHGIVESDYGWHIMYYAGEGEGAAWETQVTTALKNADYAEMLTANKASITYNDKVIADINA